MNDRRGRHSIGSRLLTAAVVVCCGCSWCWPWRETAVPDRYPLGSVNRAHYHTMQTNAEASDFILHRNEFVGNTAELSPYGKDHILEIGARAPSVPFPVVVERSENNSHPNLDEHRRAIVVQVLHDCGLSEAQQRTVVAPAYSPGLTGREAVSGPAPSTETHNDTSRLF